MIDDSDERRLNFSGVLAELLAMIGARVSVESASASTNAFHESRGVLGHSIDLQIISGWPLHRPARVAFCLEGIDAEFVVRESGLDAAFAYTVELRGGPSRTVEMHLSGGAVLIVSEHLD